jgi:hypothetical protein
VFFFEANIEKNRCQENRIKKTGSRHKALGSRINVKRQRSNDKSKGKRQRAKSRNDGKTG